MPPLGKPLRHSQLLTSMLKRLLPPAAAIVASAAESCLAETVKKGTLSSQMLRPERLDVDVRRGYVEVVPGDHVEKKDQVQNDDVEVVVDEVREVDLLLPKMSKTKTMLMSMLEVVAKRNH